MCSQEMLALAEFKTDGDWREAFNFAGEDIDHVTEIIAEDNGYNDGLDWIAVVFLQPEDYYAVISAGCDYTGWSCQAWCSFSEHYQDINKAVSKLTLTNDMRSRLETQLKTQQDKGRLKLDWWDELDNLEAQS